VCLGLLLLLIIASLEIAACIIRDNESSLLQSLFFYSRTLNVEGSGIQPIIMSAQRHPRIILYIIQSMCTRS